MYNVLGVRIGEIMLINVQMKVIIIVETDKEQVIYSMDKILIKEVGASYVNGSCWILVLRTIYLIIVAC